MTNIKKNNKQRVCPLEKAASLDTRLRRWGQNPQKILSPYLQKGMNVLDLGCGSGFFTIETAKIVGRSGKVIALDLQEGMLQKLKEKIQTTELEKRIILHKCSENKLGITEKVDFILAFYVIHEVPDQNILFQELLSILKPNGKILIAEPIFRVSKQSFALTLKNAQNAGFATEKGSRIIFSRTALLSKSN